MAASGEPDPEILPSLIRQRLGESGASEAEIDAAIAHALEEMRRA